MSGTTDKIKNLLTIESRLKTWENKYNQPGNARQRILSKNVYYPEREKMLAEWHEQWDALTVWQKHRYRRARK